MGNRQRHGGKSVVDVTSRSSAVSQTARRAHAGRRMLKARTSGVGIAKDVRPEPPRVAVSSRRKDHACAGGQGTSMSQRKVGVVGRGSALIVAAECG